MSGTKISLQKVAFSETSYNFTYFFPEQTTTKPDGSGGMPGLNGQSLSHQTLLTGTAEMQNGYISLALQITSNQGVGSMYTSPQQLGWALGEFQCVVTLCKTFDVADHPTVACCISDYAPKAVNPTVSVSTDNMTQHSGSSYSTGTFGYTYQSGGTTKTHSVEKAVNVQNWTISPTLAVVEDQMVTWDCYQTLPFNVRQNGGVDQFVSWADKCLDGESIMSVEGISVTGNQWVFNVTWLIDPESIKSGKYVYIQIQNIAKYYALSVDARGKNLQPQTAGTNSSGYVEIDLSTFFTDS